MELLPALRDPHSDFARKDEQSGFDNEDAGHSLEDDEAEQPSFTENKDPQRGLEDNQDANRGLEDNKGAQRGLTEKETEESGVAEQTVVVITRRKRRAFLPVRQASGS